MFERTVSVSSAGKLFSATGWKIGWVYGPPELVEGVGRAHQFITFAVHHPTQEAIAYALNQPDSYYTGFQQLYQRKLQLLTTALDAGGFKYRIPEGTYFAMADFSAHSSASPAEFTRYLIKEIGVACIPPESFYSPQHAHIGSRYVRFSFCKTDETLAEVSTRLAKLGE